MTCQLEMRRTSKNTSDDRTKKMDDAFYDMAVQEQCCQTRVWKKRLHWKCRETMAWRAADGDTKFNRAATIDNDFRAMLHGKNMVRPNVEATAARLGSARQTK
jgi:hypothetical protein